MVRILLAVPAVMVIPPRSKCDSAAAPWLPLSPTICQPTSRARIPGEVWSWNIGARSRLEQRLSSPCSPLPSRACGCGGVGDAHTIDPAATPGREARSACRRGGWRLGAGGRRRSTRITFREPLLVRPTPWRPTPWRPTPWRATRPRPAPADAAARLAAASRHTPPSPPR